MAKIDEITTELHKMKDRWLRSDELLNEKDKEYNSEKEIIEDGGHVSINGRTMSTVEDLDYYYSEKKEKKWKLNQ